MSELETDDVNKYCREDQKSETKTNDELRDLSLLTPPSKKLSCVDSPCLHTMKNKSSPGESISNITKHDYLNTVLKPAIQNIVCDNPKRILPVNKSSPNICLSPEISPVISTPSTTNDTSTKATEMQYYMDKLKEMVPYAKTVPKISKVQLIHCAIDYITDLQESLEARVKKKINSQSSSHQSRSPLADLSVAQQNHSNISSEEGETSSVYDTSETESRLENQDIEPQYSTSVINDTFSSHARTQDSEATDTQRGQSSSSAFLPPPTSLQLSYGSKPATTSLIAQSKSESSNPCNEESQTEKTEVFQIPRGQKRKRTEPGQH